MLLSLVHHYCKSTNFYPYDILVRRKVKLLLKILGNAFTFRSEGSKIYFCFRCSFSINIYINLFSICISDVLPEGLTHELPSADEFHEATPDAPVADNDDLEDLRRQLEAINSA